MSGRQVEGHSAPPKDYGSEKALEHCPTARSAKMAGHKKHLSDVEESVRRQPVFSSQRFDRPPSGRTSGPNLSSRSGHSQTADELISRLLNQSGHNASSQRISSASEIVQKELALAEASFNPSDLLKEGLDEWHDRSLSIQLLKKSQSMTTTRRQSIVRRDPNRTSDASGGARRLSDASSGKPEDNVPVSQQLYPESQPGTRHRYDFDFGQNDMLTTANDDGTPMDVPTEFADTLNAVPQATLIHLVMLYHQALMRHGLKDDADKIAKQLEKIESADLQDMAAELSGIDLLLRDGLLKYLMSITPYLPSIPCQVVKFKDVGFVGTVKLDAGYESMYTKARETIQGPLKKSELERVTLLRDVTGYLMPGSLTLVMGALGSGVSVINNVLSGRLVGKGRTTTGSITYNGRSLHEIKSRRLISVVGSNDTHFGDLSVRETLEYAREFSQYYRSFHYGSELKEILGEALKAGQDPKLETNLSILGLKRVASRKVGNPMVPSITEAEKHRLSVAEMLAGTYAVYMFDHLNKGMDDSVAFDIVTSIRIFTRVRGATALASLVQPSQAVFDLFDRLIVLDRGYVVYQGPRKDVLPYFESLGYVKPRQLTVAEFLEEVTSTDGARYLQPGFSTLGIEGFVAEYKKSDQYKDICRVVDNKELVEELWVEGAPPLGVNFVQSHPNKGEGIVEPLTTLVASINQKGGSLVDVSMNHTGPVHAGDEVVAVGASTGMLNYVKVGDTSKESGLSDEPSECIRLQLERPLPDERAYDAQFSRDFVQDPWPEFLLLLDRDIKTTARNKLSLMIRAVQILVLSFYIGFTFFQVHPDDHQFNFNLLRSTFFVSLLDMTLFNLGQLPGLIEERKIFYKQNGANFYRPSSYVAAKFVGMVPFAMAEATTWVIVVYFLSNLSLNQGGWHFWVFYIIISLTVLNGNAMVRFLAMFAPDLVAANGLIGILVAIFIVFAGFLVPRFQVRHWWIWAYYLDPLQWGITSLMINEFNSKRYSAPCSTLTLEQIRADLPQCVNRPNQPVGHAYLAKGQFYSSNGWIGIAIACLVGWFVVWTLLTLLAAEKLRHQTLIIVTPTAEAKFLKRTESIIARDVEGQGPKLSLLSTPVTLSWHELSYDILIPSVSKTLSLLTYVSGWAEPGELVGLAGATGAGKTILLNCLAGRGVQTPRIGGQILVNGRPKNQLAFIRISGYVDKLEAYSPYMTVREAIMFSSAVMLGDTTTVAERSLFVDEIIDLMELKGVQKFLIKSLGESYLTAADATKLRIAAELARNASIIFIDAPTRNLDGRSTLHVVKILKEIAESGRVVIAAMEIPSQRIANCFTSMQILKRGGETVYWGPVGKDGELIKAYFESIPGTPLCPPSVCVTSYAIDVVGDGVQDRKAIKDYAFEYRVNELALHNHMQLQALRRGKEVIGPEINEDGYGSSYLTRAWLVFSKVQLFYWRNVAYSWGRLFSSIVMAILLGSIFWQQKSDTTPAMNAKSSAIFISTLLQCISNAQAVIPQVGLSRPAYNREKTSGHLSVLMYSVSWTMAEVPYLAFSVLCFAAIFCGMSGIATQTPWDFFRYWVLLFEISLAITFFGMFLASASVLPQIAGTLVTIFIGFWVATSGVVVPKKKILPYMIWIFWTNPIQFALTAMSEITFYCQVNSSDCENNGLNKACASSAAACPTCHCERLQDTGQFTWSTLKYNRNFHHGSANWYMLVLFGFIVVFRASTLLVWKYHARKW